MNKKRYKTRKKIRVCVPDVVLGNRMSIQVKMSTFPHKKWFQSRSGLKPQKCVVSQPLKR